MITKTLTLLIAIGFVIYFFSVSQILGGAVIYLVIGHYVYERWHWSYDGNLINAIAIVLLWPLWLIGLFCVNLYRTIRY